MRCNMTDAIPLIEWRQMTLSIFPAAAAAASAAAVSVVAAGDMDKSNDELCFQSMRGMVWNMSHIFCATVPCCPFLPPSLFRSGGRRPLDPRISGATDGHAEVGDAADAVAGRTDRTRGDAIVLGDPQKSF